MMLLVLSRLRMLRMCFDAWVSLCAEGVRYPLPFCYKKVRGNQGGNPEHKEKKKCKLKISSTNQVTSGT